VPAVEVGAVVSSTRRSVNGRSRICHAATEGVRVFVSH
jgi:hypothetical protein